MAKKATKVEVNVTNVKVFNEKNQDWDNGKLTPRPATAKEAETLQEILLIGQKINDLAKMKAELLATLPQNDPMVGHFDVRYDDDSEEIVRQCMTLVIGRPEWKSVKCDPVSFTKKAKTTKAEKAYIQYLIDEKKTKFRFEDEEE